MECSRIKIILLENGGSDFSAEIREKVESHLAGCPSCAALAESLREQSNALKSLPELKAPVSLVSAVRRELEKPGIFKRIALGLSEFLESRWTLRFAGTAAAAILVVLIVQFGLHENGPRKAEVAPPEQKADISISGTPQSQPGPEGETKESSSPQAPEPARPLASLTPGTGAIPSARTELSNPPQAAPPAEHQRYSRKKAPAGSGPYVEITLLVPGQSTSLEGAGMSAQAEANREAGDRLKSSMPTAREGFKAKENRPATMGAKSAPREMAGESSIESEIRLLIYRSNGKLLNDDFATGEKSRSSLLAEIPAENYPALRRDLDRLGATGSSIDPPSGTKVRVRINMVPAR